MTAAALGVSMLLWWLVIGHPNRPVATPSEAPMSPRTTASAYQPIPIQTDVYAVPPGYVYRIPGVIGPATPSLVSQPEPTLPSHYAGGGSSRLAILVTDVQSNWLGLAHGLKSFGVPFTVTTDPYEALRHRVIMVYPVLSGRVLPPTALKAVVAHPRKGGTLIASNIYGEGVEKVFGFQEIRYGRDHYELRLAVDAPLLEEFTDPAEQVLPLGNHAKRVLPIATWSYSETKEPPLARYEDGSAAITRRSYEVGHAYAIGLDLGHLLLKGHNLRDEGLARSYDNRYEPMLDVFLRLLAAVYREGEPDAVRLHPVLRHRDLAVIMTHDIDAQTSMANAIQYAQFEKSQGIVGTYFVQTKCIKDFNDEVFLNDQGINDMAALHRLGMELASHTVAHSTVFSHFPLGTGTERYPEYQPYVKTRTTTANGSVFGELRVSKYLIEKLSGGANVMSFRPGGLSNPKALPQALASTGYRYSSSSTANNSLTHLPYQLMVNRDVETESEVFEFPITIEDEALPEMGSRVPEALAVAAKVARYGGSIVVLIHPNILSHKMTFEREFVAAVRDAAWFGSIGQYGTWWAARNRVEVDVQTRGIQKVLSVMASEQLVDLTVQIPKTWRLAMQQTPAPIEATGEKFVVLGAVQGTVRLVFDVLP
ncbi:MAG: hypothetical protein OEV71_15510 [Nitrospira sp.]|nr:hypothetical protein [Nitrospira sp.]MDH4344495.1 hypothetical protein [Nitrospira sp.]